jgi:hypothetical protein
VKGEADGGMTARHLPVVVLERRVDATVGIGNKAPPEDTP